MAASQRGVGQCPACSYAASGNAQPAPMPRRAMPSLLLCRVGRRPKSFSTQHEQLENGRTERRPCHTAVTTRCGSGEVTGDGSRRFPVVRTGRESLRDSQVRPPFDWGSSGANANTRRPARQSFRFSSPNTMARLGEQEIGESAPDAGVGVLWPSREVMPTRRGGAQNAL
jgi:hypothetical protein